MQVEKVSKSEYKDYIDDCKSMNKLCELMGIPLIDHIIVGGDNREFFSFREKGMIDNPKITLSTDLIKKPVLLNVLQSLRRLE